MYKEEGALQPFLNWEDAISEKPDKNIEVLVDSGNFLHLGYYDSSTDQYIESTDFSVVAAKYWAYIPSSPCKRNGT